jgi:hypothetical protein
MPWGLSACNYIVQHLFSLLLFIDIIFEIYLTCLVVRVPGSILGATNFSEK